ncbi:GTP cyclohydrolase 1 type 2 [Zhongshania aliphaticivorans]|uniref:GTP cyclohydrolase 1 type 2 n=1 Tax=Zhongshania aliphaticivorans TaxID=1470434 RepID=A0A5S9NK16_9GAMM|nr:NGG1p interacting factor NIF3 [Zhongshania aliphaticivorans]CAA0090191.1 GTP cyclohydrolase 1 type 2 [Zhongshania aliphaticivorans]CAA0097569.1 GTP cyclohydrolase 1 type 2 [Zhongshania aliphaticivorans]
MYKLVFFVPVSHCEAVKRAVFDAGAGGQGEYESCSWQVLGQGQFLPLKGSQPFVGSHGKLEIVDEFRVETLCEKDFIHGVVAALKKAHPYEEPAYEIYKLEVI